VTAKELFQSGKLAQAVDEQLRVVRAKPTDAAARTFLFELLCFQGEFDRAQKQLDVIAQQDPDSEWATQVYSNILAAEGVRRRVLEEGGLPEFVMDPPDLVHLQLEALGHLRNGRSSEALACLENSQSARVECPGDVDGQAVDDFCDCDDLFGPILEMVILRDYVWIPWQQIRELEISAAERPRDLIWIPIRLTLADGSARSGYAPTRYPGTHRHPDDAVKLGRMTDWQSQDGGPVRGVGLREFLVGDATRSILEIRHVALAPTA
jgi:type VI secretion system protein ImpE